MNITCFDVGGYIKTAKKDLLTNDCVYAVVGNCWNWIWPFSPGTESK